MTSGMPTQRIYKVEPLLQVEVKVSEH